MRMTYDKKKEEAKEGRETTLQYLKIISYSLWLVITVVGIVIAVKYAQVMDHVADAMQQASESMSEVSDSGDYDSSDYAD